MEQNEPNKVDQAAPMQRKGMHSYIILAIIAGGLAMPLVLLGGAGIYASRLLEGELILTRTGCRALEYHGASVDYLEEGTACAIKTKFRIGMRDRSGPVLVRTEQGDFRVELSAKEVVSKSYR